MLILGGLIFAVLTLGAVRFPGAQDQVPMLIATGEASGHAQCHHCTSEFLRHAMLAPFWRNSAGRHANPSNRSVSSLGADTIAS